MQDIITKKQLAKEIETKRSAIAEQLIQKAAVMNSEQLPAISTADLRLLFELYDEVFLENWFRDNYEGKIKFSLSRKMTKSAGKTICPKNIALIKSKEVVFEIRIGVDFFLNYGLLTKSNIVCGLKANSSLEALLLVFEHELCHVIEFLLFNKSSCKGARFKVIAGNIFGHIDSYHKLPTNKQIANKVYGFKIGDSVVFEYKERKLTGFIYNINKRAVLLVPDKNGILADKHGKRYSKYYVPLSQLKSS